MQCSKRGKLVMEKRMTRSSKRRIVSRPLRHLCLVACLMIVVSAQAQYRGDHIPGFIGLESGTQAPPGVYVGNLVYVYPTDTLKGDNGNSVHLPGGLTSTADAVLMNVT